jgi:hypothetical protein
MAKEPTSVWRFWTRHGQYHDIECTLDECQQLLETRLFIECMMLKALQLVGMENI